MKNRAMIGATMGLLLIGATGCTTSGLEAIGKPGDPKLEKHLVIHNDVLAGKITIAEMNTRTTGGLLEVSLVLANLSDSDKKMQYRFSWYDSANFEVEQGTGPWTPIVLHGKASANLQAVAPNTTVTTYKLNVREMQ